RVSWRTWRAARPAENSNRFGSARGSDGGTRPWRTPAVTSAASAAASSRRVGSDARSGSVVGLPEPADQLPIHRIAGRQPHAVGHHRIPAPGGLEPSGGRYALQDEAEVEARLGRGLHQAELLRAAQAHVGLLRREFDVGPEAP